ncbi:hypothetical protein RRG08_039524 [Elysia crispata]|uniref:Uncharacterized protein n=1 Tax=Elysia crispata TaxID=231223 RepID=A0AAE0YKX6_9GAST|nr:hypothetical protein RRG08_039524 [Elysia crispata]
MWKVASLFVVAVAVIVTAQAQPAPVPVPVVNPPQTQAAVPPQDQPPASHYPPPDLGRDRYGPFKDFLRAAARFAFGDWSQGYRSHFK